MLPVSPGCLNMRTKTKILSFIFMSFVIVAFGCKNMAYMTEKWHKTFHATFGANPLNVKNILSVTRELVMIQSITTLTIREGWGGLLDGEELSKAGWAWGHQEDGSAVIVFDLKTSSSKNNTVAISKVRENETLFFWKKISYFESKEVSTWIRSKVKLIKAVSRICHSA